MPKTSTKTESTRFKIAVYHTKERMGPGAALPRPGPFELSLRRARQLLGGDSVSSFFKTSKAFNDW